MVNPELGDVLKLPISRTLESTKYCFECGEEVLTERIKTNKFDPITGNSYQVRTVICPNWRPGGWFNKSRHTAYREELVWEHRYQ